MQSRLFQTSILAPCSKSSSWPAVVGWCKPRTGSTKSPMGPRASCTQNLSKIRRWPLVLWGIMALLLSHLAFASVDVNTADEKQLRTVKGIGPVKAKALITWRSKNGSFRSVADVRRVKGFGAKTLARIGHDLTIAGRPLMPAPPAGR